MFWTVAAVSLGGALGALARYGLMSAFASMWMTLGINVVGCLLIGVLMVVLIERRPVHPLWRPFLGVGVLGGFTTFSAYVVDFQRAGATVSSLVYLVGTMVAAVVAVFAGVRLTRWLAGVRR